MTDQEMITRSREAAEVLNNAAYKAAIATLKDQVVQQWRDCPIRDHEGQLLLLQLAKLTEKFGAILTSMVEAGPMAEMKISLDSERNESKVQRLMRRVAR